MSRGSSSKSLLCSSCKLGLRKYSLLSIHLLALVFEVLVRRVDFHLQAAFLDSMAHTCCSSLNAVQSRKLSSLNQSNESALSNEDFKLMDIDIAGRVHLAYDIRLDLQFACLFPQGGCVHNES